MRAHHRATFAAALLALLVTACDGGDSPRLQIDAAGGTATGPNGAILVLSARALSQDVSLQITEVNPSALATPAGSAHARLDSSACRLWSRTALA